MPLNESLFPTSEAYRATPLKPSSLKLGSPHDFHGTHRYLPLTRSKFENFENSSQYFMCIITQMNNRGSF